MNSRKGLKRVGMRRWKIGGYIIERDRPRRWHVFPEGWPGHAGFFDHRFTRLREARAYAEGKAT